MAGASETLVLLFAFIDASVDRGRAEVLETGVGEAVVLTGSVGSRFGGFLELFLCGAIMLPTDSLENCSASRTWSSMSPICNERELGSGDVECVSWRRGVWSILPKTS